MNRKRLWKAGFGALALLLLISGGPTCIHLFYRLTTPQTVVLSNRSHYETLANGESGLSAETQETSIRKRYELSLWFHARGLNIDEGDDHESLWKSIKQPWLELMEYWKL